VEKLLCTVEIQGAAHLGEQENIAQDAQKGRSARPQRAKRRRRTLRYVELLSEARTPLADFFSSVLVRVRFRTQAARWFQGVLFNQGERLFESIHRRGRGRWCKSITVPPL